MWLDLVKALLAVLAFVLSPFLVIAAAAGALALEENFRWFLTHRHQH
ncbi:MAG TPA: hypothetical protein VEU62_07010 [Bryobacterales bacterium]|nr:hypothetical protein [Bryobacterales bacterium]